MLKLRIITTLLIAFLTTEALGNIHLPQSLHITCICTMHYYIISKLALALVWLHALDYHISFQRLGSLHHAHVRVLIFY